MAPEQPSWHREVASALIVLLWFTKRLIPPDPQSRAVQQEGWGGWCLSDPSLQAVKLRSLRLIQHKHFKILVNYFWNNARHETINCPSFSPLRSPTRPVPEVSHQQTECPFSCQSLTQITRFTEKCLETVLVPPHCYLGGCSRTSHIWQLKRKPQTLNQTPTIFCYLF